MNARSNPTSSGTIANLRIRKMNSHTSFDVQSEVEDVVGIFAPQAGHFFVSGESMTWHLGHQSGISHLHNAIQGEAPF